MSKALIETLQKSGSLIGDLRALVDHSEQLMEATRKLGGESLDAIRRRLGDSLKQVSTHLPDLEEKAAAAGKRTYRYMHDHPWRTAGVLAGMTLLVGVVSVGGLLKPQSDD